MSDKSAKLELDKSFADKEPDVKKLKDEELDKVVGGQTFIFGTKNMNLIVIGANRKIK